MPPYSGDWKRWKESSERVESREITALIRIYIVTQEIKKTILIFGGLCVLILLLFGLEQWSLFALGGSENLYLIISGVLFLILGIFFSQYVYFKIEKRERRLRKSSLTDQELQVLELIANGHSNKEIAQNLFIAESTVKSHVSNIFTKLDARRRTEAVKIGRDLEII